MGMSKRKSEKQTSRSVQTASGSGHGIWKISPGDRGTQWKQWLEHGVAAIGFSMRGRVGSIGQYPTFNLLLAALERMGYSNPHYSSKQLWQFASVIGEGDLLVAYKLYGLLDVGVVDGPCRLVWDRLAQQGKLFAYRRKVRWLGLGPRPLSDPAARRHLSRNITLFPIMEEKSLKLVYSMLRSTTEGGSYLMKVTRTPMQAYDCGAPPSRIKTTEYRVLRDTAKSIELKSDYEYRCQICGKTMVVPGKGCYTEAHHIRPLGFPHSGPDDKSNMLCLCPHHHAEMDLGVFFIDPASLTIVHSNPRDKYNNRRLRFRDDHEIDRDQLKYHRDRICSAWKV